MGLEPSYVLDEMTSYELSALMKYNYYKVKDVWESARLVAYMTAQVNSKKKLKFTDILEFSWDEKDKDSEITRQDVERLKEKAQEYLRNIKDKEIR